MKTDKELAKAPGAEIVESVDASLLDLIDNVLNKGVILRGEAVLGVAGVDLVYLRISALLCAADRMLVPATKAGRGEGEGP